MKLIYAYIHKFRNIKQQEIYFTKGYSISYEPKCAFPDSLHIQFTETDNASEIIYRDSKLSDIHIIVGKTGSGKTNIFQMIGMPEDERTRDCDRDDSYFLLYRAADSFVIEPFHIPIDSHIRHDFSFHGSMQRGDEYSWLPRHMKEYMQTLDSMKMYRFSLDSSGHPNHIVQISSPDKLDKDITFIFNGYERYAFSFCPYEEKRFDSVSANTKWQQRINAEYHRTALWDSCVFLKEYIDSFAPDNIKRKAALVIKRENWADTIKQHLDEKLERHDYWTFAGRIQEEGMNRVLEKTIKRHKHVAIRHQFVHDLWTDFALYLRRWISYIDMFPQEIPTENLDASGTVDVYQEFLDYYFEKEQDEYERKTGKRDKNRIDPIIVPDFEKISILKRLEWLAMYIDRRGDGVAHSLLWQIYDDIKDIGNILSKFDNKYFTNDEFILPIEDMYTTDNKELVEQLFERMEQYRPDDVGIFTKELLPYSFAYISSGEYQLAKILGGIQEFCVKLSTNGGHPNIIYLLDEPETYMHPELCRTFISRLASIISERVSESDIQILISTHSPFFLSDILPEQITRLDLDEKGYCIVKNDTDKAYFGANIHTILADGFFLDYTIGEYARFFLQKEITWLKSILNNNMLSAGEKEHLKQLEVIVPYIGDTLIRKSFEALLEMMEVVHD